MSKRQKTDVNQLFNNLAKELHELVTNKQILRNSLEKFLNNVVDEITLGIIFDYHRKYKTLAFDLDAKNCASSQEDDDIFNPQKLKKTQECVCPNCDKSVAASRFAPHLEACMGMGRSRSRTAARRVASNNSGKEKDNYNYAEVISDEEDIDWNSRDKRKKKKDKKGKKKTIKGATNRKGDSEAGDIVNIDVEGDDDDITNLRDLLQDNSNSSFPAESVASNNSHSSSSKKRDKSKSKKSSKKDRSSPSSCISID